MLHYRMLLPAVQYFFAAIDRFLIFKCPMRLSSLAAELIAIREAILAAIEDRVTDLVIFTDSRNACISLRESKWENFLVSEII